MKLKILFITNLLERRGRNRLRCIMHGYRFLKESNQLGLITEVKEALTNTHLGKISVHSSTVIFGTALKNSELIIRQYLLVRVGSMNLNKSLLYALGKPGSKVIHPLPPEWRKIIEQHGFKVAKIRSALAWNGFVMTMLAYGFASIAIQTFKNIKSIFHPSYHSLGEYAYFDTLTAGNLPQPCSDGRSHDIVTWYQQWPGRVKELDTLCHGVKGNAKQKIEGISVISIPSAILPLSHLSAMVRFIGWGITASLKAFVDLFRGRWWHALLLSQAAKSAQVRLQDTEKLARDYLFHNSGWIYRPLWTYEAEKLGSRIIFYFYSTNCESFKTPEGYPIQANNWQAMNWSLYLVWDEYQADFVRRAVGEGANINIVGPIWFQTSVKEIQSLTPRSIAVFDVQPFRDSRYQIFGLDKEYYTPNTANQFLHDIYQVIKECEASMVLKRKRNIGNMLNRRYAIVVDKLNNSDNLVAIEPDISAILVIEKCNAVISMPFTSTALLGKELGKPSIYYDPHSIVQKNDRAAHGIPIISGVVELRHWITTVCAMLPLHQLKDA